MAKTYIPHKYQQVFHQSRERFRGLFAGRRGGKTVAGAIESLYWMDRGRSNCCNILMPPKTDVCPACGQQTEIRPVQGQVVAPTYQDLMDVNVKAIMEWLPEEAIESWNKVEMRLLLKNGSELVFRSADNPDKIGRGRKFDFIWLDEARDYKDFKTIWETLQPTLADYEGHAWVTTTTNGKDAVWKEFFEPAAHVWGPKDQLSDIPQDPAYSHKAGKLENLSVVTFRTIDNPAIPRGEVENAKLRMSEQMYRQEYFATIEKFSGLIYSMFDERVHVIPKLPEIPTNDLIYFVGIDVGYTNPTAILLVAEDREGNLYVVDEWYESQKLAPDIAQAIKNMTEGIEVYQYIIDPASKGTHQTSGMSVMDQIRENGIPVMPGNNDVRAGIDRVAQILRVDPEVGKPGIYILAKCTNLLTEFAHYVWEESKDEHGNKKERPRKAFDHALDALRYVLMERPDRYGHPELDRYGRIIPPDPAVTIDGGEQWVDPDMF